MQIDPKNLMALERAVAALIGIAISFIALGFIIEKFELFLHMLSLQLKKPILISKMDKNAIFYKWFGISIIAIGGILAIYTYFYYVKWIELLKKGEIQEDKKIFFILSLLVAIIAIILILSIIKF